MGKSLKEFPCSYHPLCGCDGARRQRSRRFEFFLRGQKKKSATDEESGGSCALYADLLFIIFILLFYRLIRVCQTHPFCDAVENFSAAVAPNVWLRVEEKLRQTAASVCQAADVPNLFLFCCFFQYAATVFANIKQLLAF